MTGRERADEGDGPDRAEESFRRSPLERPIALAAPLLDLLLWFGERISRLAEPVDHEHYPVRNPDQEDRKRPDDR
jgi:hypothetical protein